MELFELISVYVNGFMTHENNEMLSANMLVAELFCICT